MRIVLLANERFCDAIGWPARPTSPTSIRLISFGKVLDDESLLKGTAFFQLGATFTPS